MSGDYGGNYGPYCMARDKESLSYCSQMRDHDDDHVALVDHRGPMVARWENTSMRTRIATEPAIPIPMNEFLGSGMLWAINKFLLHPQGFSLAFAMNKAGELVGWQVLGDGTEPRHFDADEPEATAYAALLDARRSHVQEGTSV
jgi:hypothetical protein